MWEFVDELKVRQRGYLSNLLLNFPDRLGNSLYGVTGWWIFDIFYMTPFLTLPWLYALNRRRWNR